jgi:hypothetical protein
MSKVALLPGFDLVISGGTYAHIGFRHAYDRSSIVHWSNASCARKLGIVF